VVELRIFEGEAKNDITFSYNANFFLFATLETARPIIHGRVQQAAQQIPVLTGMPVSGMAYLDRPSEAGYFIFPDLSVRHEGKYRLSFNLYEETKEAKDQDADQPATAQADAPNGSFDWRLEVKSAPFTVFSAKKFPGLAESTILSRTVAEQGCRVRIRRDVRMRRREGKASGEYDEFEDDYRRTRSATPAEPAHEYSRQRSLSNSNNGDGQPYDQHRRPSGEPYPGHQYPAPYSHGPTSTPQPPASYLSFGGSSTQQPQFQTPQFAQPAPPPPQPQQSHQSGPSQYHQAPPYTPQQSPGSYNLQERPQYGQYQGARDYDSEYRRQSLTYGPTSQPTNTQYPHDEQDSNPPSASYPPYQSRSEQPVLAPIKVNPTPTLEPKYESMSSPIGPLSASNRMSTSSLPSPGYPERSGSYSSYPPAPSATETPRAGSKRSYDSVFSGGTYNQPLHNGMRPSSSHNASAGYLDNEDISMEAFTMRYKRADGTPQNRELPALE
jgi:hypothetical protein